jgi:hypothetical protein
MDGECITVVGVECVLGAVGLRLVRMSCCKADGEIEARKNLALTVVSKTVFGGSRKK